MFPLGQLNEVATVVNSEVVADKSEPVAFLNATFTPLFNIVPGGVSEFTNTVRVIVLDAPAKIVPMLKGLPPVGTELTNATFGSRVSVTLTSVTLSDPVLCTMIEYSSSVPGTTGSGSSVLVTFKPDTGKTVTVSKAVRVVNPVLLQVTL